ncbi:translation initiation factor IF-2 [Brevundimonas sp.]|uniref:translation initiation factor IF-2 n=1 Tax=Brevundimonas sp. TaxID=1871086 RepID=UPI0025CECD1C|nr:translation initiation factor IF-2 [Brevundimonas sp.]
MSLRTALAAIAVLACASPALAQETPAQPTAPERQPTAEELAMQAAAEAFDGRMQAMGAELQAVMTDASTSSAQKTASVDSILGVYTPEINAFADQLVAFLNSMAAQTTDPQEQAALQQASVAADANIRGIPDQVRSSVAAHLANQAAAATGGSGAVAGTVPVQ